MRNPSEKPFEYLKRKDGAAFSPETVKNWYKARAYVLDKLKGVTIGPNSKEHLHAVVTSDSPLMLSVVREVALLAHYVNFDESTGQHRTLITLVSKNRQILAELEKEEYLCNLTHLCKYTLFESAPVNSDSYLDIELKVSEDTPKDNDGITVTLSEEEANAFISSKNPEEVFSIDTRKAVLAGRIYDLGTLIDDMPAEDIHDTKRYKFALDVFKHKLLRKAATPMIDAQTWETDPVKVKNGLSNIFLTDCFESKRSLCTEENNEVLSKSEHARWVAEKLIMGFRPLNRQESIHDERLFGEAKRQYRRQLKQSSSDPVHIDLCSYAELRRINPNDLKYDTFLMLAIEAILNKL